MLLNTYVKASNGLKNFLKRKDGQSFVEYLIIIVIVAVALIGAVIALSGVLEDEVNEVTREIEDMRQQRSNP